ncbi:MAG: hypothetical protein KatS3mg114_0285 [Planctomycetaceae bacterium]|nr:MAG: hypothetical protein KatS3mg114_0285 [Planctomycetaceae bacterium]
MRFVHVSILVKPLLVYHPLVRKPQDLSSVDPMGAAVKASGSWVNDLLDVLF